MERGEERGKRNRKERREGIRKQRIERGGERGMRGKEILYE